MAPQGETARPPSGREPDRDGGDFILGLDDRLLDLLPSAVCVCNADGSIVRYNRCAAALWGRAPAIGERAERGEGPMSEAMRGAAPVRNREVVIERPDGSRILVMADVDPLRDVAGRVVGAVNSFRDITDRGSRRQAEPAERRSVEGTTGQLASIVESSGDAIISCDLDGRITSWNAGAQRLYGYAPAEAMGRPITMLTPSGRPDEEMPIIQRIRNGEHVEHYETLRQRRDGTLVPVSLTASPVKDAEGRIVGVSKIARDNSEVRRAQERQELLLREMNHRIKNLFALASGMVMLSARSATSARDMATKVQGRLSALARAHDLTLSRAAVDRPATEATTLDALIQTIVSPYDDGSGPWPRRIVTNGPEVAVGAGAITSVALLIYELATNAARHGALAAATGQVLIDWRLDGPDLSIVWREQGAPSRVIREPTPEGFGSLLSRATVTGQLGGAMTREWTADGVVIRLTVPAARLAA